MENDATIWVVLISAGAALAGALGAQLIAVLGGLKAKRFELLFSRKADAYADLHRDLGHFALDPSNNDKYLQYLASQQTALLFASPEGTNALSGKPDGLSLNAQRLRSSETTRERGSVQVTTWFDSAEAATTAMNADLRRMSGGSL